jgi:hypothetical protein
LQAGRRRRRNAQEQVPLVVLGAEVVVHAVRLSPLVEADGVQLDEVEGGEGAGKGHRGNVRRGMEVGRDTDARG